MKSFFKSVVVSILTLQAAAVLRRHKPIVIAVTGSVGKTSTKDAIFAAIKNHTHARKSQKSFNSDVGVPLTVLGLPNGWNNPFLWLRNIGEGCITACFSRSYPAVLVLETGIDRPGDMEKLTRWLKPDMVVLTRLPDVPVHVEYFSSPAAVIREKMKLVSALKSEGVLIFNNDDPAIQSQLPEVLQRQVGFGRYLDTDFNAREDRVVYNDDVPVGIEFTIAHQDTSHRVYVAGTVGTQHVYSCSAAIAVAHQLDIPLDAAATDLAKLETPNGRMRIVSGIKGTMLIDDTYNSSPTACEQALQALQELEYAKRKIVVLGDMLELGKYSTDEHRRIGAMVPRVGSLLLTVGVRARQIAEGALSAGFSEEQVLQYDDVYRAGTELQQLLEPGDVVLIKASQSIRAERIVEEVMEEPLRAGELLVRQEEVWKSIA